MDPMDVFVAEPSPEELEQQIAMASFGVMTSSPLSQTPRERILAGAHPLSFEDFEWLAGIRPVWPGMDTSRCVAAVNARPGEDLQRLLAGTRRRGETALLLMEVGFPQAALRRPKIYPGEDAPDDFPGHLASVDGRELPSGVKPTLVEGLDGTDRDLALRLRDHHAPAEAWFAVDPPTPAPRPAERFVPILGDFQPLLVDDVGEPVAGVWIPREADARCYLFSYGSDWELVLRWLVDQAVPAYVPSAALRARASEVPEVLLTPEERKIREELADLEGEYQSRKAEIQARAVAAEAAARPLREGLLYGRGDDLKLAVKRVLEDCGFEVEDLDETFGRPVSADLLVSLKGQYWLVEVRYAGGAPGHPAVDDVRRHIRGWAGLGRQEHLEVGVFIVNHHANDPPTERLSAPYQDQAFVGALECTVIGTPALYQWWADGSVDHVVKPVTGPPGQQAATEPPEA